MQQCRMFLELEHDAEEGLYDARVPALDHVWGFRSVQSTPEEALNDLMDLFDRAVTERLLSGEGFPEFVPDASLEDNCCCE